MDEQRRIVGTPYPQPRVDASSFREQLYLRSGGERWGISRTDVLKRFPFPEVPGERFVPEALVWNRIAMHYKMRFVNERLRIYRRRDDGLMAKLLRLRVQSPHGTRLYYAELCRSPLSYWGRAGALVNYLRFSLHAGQISLRETNHPVIAGGLMPAGYLAYQRDCFNLR